MESEVRYETSRFEDKIYHNNFFKLRGFTASRRIGKIDVYMTLKLTMHHFSLIFSDKIAKLKKIVKFTPVND